MSIILSVELILKRDKPHSYNSVCLSFIPLIIKRPKKPFGFLVFDFHNLVQPDGSFSSDYVIVGLFY